MKSLDLHSLKPVQRLFLRELIGGAHGIYRFRGRPGTPGQFEAYAEREGKLRYCGVVLSEIDMVDLKKAVESIEFAIPLTDPPEFVPFVHLPVASRDACAQALTLSMQHDALARDQDIVARAHVLAAEMSRTIDEGTTRERERG